MKGLRFFGSALLGVALLVGCEKKEEKTPSGATATNPEASKKAAGEMKSAAGDAGDAAKSAINDAAKQAKSDAGSAADAMKKNANAAADAANTSTAAADADAKLKTVMDAIKDKKWDIAESTLKTLETNKASLPQAVQDQIGNARKMLDAGKAGLAAPSTPALPKP